METVKAMLCDSRHEMPPDVTCAVFPKELDMDIDKLEQIADDFLHRHFGKPKTGPLPAWREPLMYAGERRSHEKWHYTNGTLEVYVTGFTPAVIALINACRENGFTDLRFMHYDKETGGYVPQEVIT